VGLRKEIFNIAELKIKIKDIIFTPQRKVHQCPNPRKHKDGLINAIRTIKYNTTFNKHVTKGG
jgi:hypothetical protein